MSFFNRAPYLAAVGLLAGCMGGGGGDAPGPTFGELRSDLVTQLDAVETIGFAEINNPASLPSSGSANYNGVVSVVIFEASETSPGSDLQILGDLNITANFGTDRISGGARDFSDSDGGTYAGQLNVTGDIRKNPPADQVTILGRIGGTLENEQGGGTFTVKEFQGDGGAFMAGDLYGPDNQYMFGVIRGEIVTPEGALLIWDTDAVGEPDGDGIFVAEK